MNISVDKVLPNPEQPRKDFNAEELNGLAKSIRENGVIVAITVEEAPGGAYILHDGERRLRAAKMAGLREIPALIVPALNGNGSRERLVRALVANLQRADLNPIEEARAYQEMIKIHGMTQAQIAGHCGTYPARVAARLKLIELDEPIQELVAKGRLPVSPEVVDAILSIKDSKSRSAFAEKAAGRGLTNKAIIAACTNLKKQLENESSWDGDHAPVVIMANKRSGSKVERARWDMLAQVGSLPPWSMVIMAATEACDRCALRGMASQTTCQECPGVDLLAGMMRKAIPHE